MSDKPVVKLKYRNKEYDVPAGMTVRDAIKKVGLQPETVLAVLDKKLLTDDAILREGMEIKLVAVISGGASPLRLPSPDCALPVRRGVGGEA
jgi:sulfur carrier protein ThiS